MILGLDGNLSMQIFLVLFSCSVFLLSFLTYRKVNQASFYDGRPSAFKISLFERLVVPLQVFTLMGALTGILNVQLVSFSFIATAPLFKFLGVSLTSLGAAIFIISISQLGKQYSPCYDVRQPTQVVSYGFYKYIRHPIYLGNFLVLGGVLLISGSFLVVAAGLTISVFYVKSAIKEEKHLLMQFPSYATYKKQTGRFLPRLVRRNESVQISTNIEI